MSEEILFSLAFISKMLDSIYITKERKLEVIDSLEKLNDLLSGSNDPSKQLKLNNLLAQSFFNLTLNSMLMPMLGKKGIFPYIQGESIKLYKQLISSEEELNKFLSGLRATLSSIVNELHSSNKQQLMFIPNFIKLIRNTVSLNSIGIHKNKLTVKEDDNISHSCTPLTTV